MRIGKQKNLKKKMMIFDPTQNIGEERSYNHGEDCLQYGEHSGDYRGRLYVKRTEYGWIWYCHNCGGSGRKVDYSGREITFGGIEKSTRFSKILSGTWRKSPSGQSFKLPWDFDRQIPEIGLRWLNKYITKEEIGEYGIGWSNYFGRVVLPIYSEGRLVAYQLRKVDQRKGPKYLTFKEKGVRNVVFTSGVGNNGDCVCIVEDILSAIKVGRVVRGLALLGSPPSLPPIIQYLGGDVKIWLDKDKLKTGIRYRDQLQLMGYESQVIITQQDPKAYTTEEVQQWLRK